MSKEMVAYVPVLHRGYREFFLRHKDAKVLHVLGEEILQEFDHLYRKDIRALSAEEVVSALHGWQLPFRLNVAGYETLEILNESRTRIVMPDEGMAHTLAKRYLSRCSVDFDTVFLRRDKKRTTQEVPISSDIRVSREKLHRELIARTVDIARQSPDWWYHIGALAARDGEVLFAAFNSYRPTPHTAYAFGDPRIHFKAGVSFELTQALHAEAAVICRAAEHGVSLKGVDLYTTMFPCPWCAKMIAYSGVRRVFFREGYSRLDGESILRSRDVEIIQVT